MVGEEFHHGGKHRRIAQSGSQIVGVKACQRQQALRAVGIFQQPAKCRKSQDLRLICRAAGGMIGG